jgi:hypothetical protein
MAKLQTYFYTVILGVAMLTVAYVIIFAAFRYLFMWWRAGEGRVTFFVLLAIFIGVGVFFTAAVIGVTISIVEGTHAILPT